MVGFKQFINETTKEEEYSSLVDEVMLLLQSEGATEFWIDDESTTIEIAGEDYIERKDGKVVKTSKLYKDGEITNYDLAISRLRDAVKAIKDGQIVVPQE